MTDRQRIKGKPVAIDYDSTLAFFEGRATRDYRNALSSTMYQDQQPELVEERDRREKLRVAPGFALPAVRKVLDIGCGIGRWGWLVAEQAPHAAYLGIDFSTALVEKARREARQRGHGRLVFQEMSATDIRPAELALSPPYDLLLISGLLIYLNDVDCLELLRQALRLCAPDGRMYLREPVAIEQRLTLDRFFSQELQHEYSAVYRTATELKDMLAQAGGGQAPAILEEDCLFAETLEKRAETRQYFMILQRRG
ncbi:MULTISPECIES: class I SAM-dependent methyltransferase [Pseudomonas aeruginosa group]|uniref:class I SAM-dependent methyltransferase n=1 Tax=Pseudomonas aeruginosa group TaxID=136841 RepID=UPI00071B9572|nr:class I SAM-dependent methyltransferase [Pseudomonas aeruginosa]KSR48076.1 methyltransferase type 12 [Pseudomonas aeruginosa]RPV08804.1 class I SAM-dependent methyltransferase [Pseudomonas aeruginosa]